MVEIEASNGYDDGDEEKQITDWDLPLSFRKSRHTDTIEGVDAISQTWRMKERMKTVSVALVLCLNVGVDPPDIVKTQPCARLECWIDPLSMSPPKALETIGSTLQKQYERWQPRARYKQSLDPTVDEVKKLCTSLRRNAKEERVLFHYNGHGVPKPTSNGEIWVFNRTYTQYIPLSVYDLQTWMGAPSIYVYDCSCAGIIVESFKTFAEQHRNEHEAQRAAQAGRAQSPPPPPCFHGCIQLAACGPHQILPMNPDLPADMFTACLTTPIKVALRWFVMQNTSRLVPRVTLDLVDKIPGQLNDRRTMLGELNWIFTAITDTIAWNTLPRDLFQKLFRQDLLVASLFRNFLLAERILRSYDCAPVSWPALPATYQHAMWQAWDLALDLSLNQLPGVLHGGQPFCHLPFFEEQLTAFQVWLSLGSEQRSPPEQLPIVLQVLLSQVHRLRALELLGRFLDLGPWAVNLALSVGIFPYVLKLLQSSARELRPLLVFIWAKILAVDSTCQGDLVRDNGHRYFLAVLQDAAAPSEHRTLAAFVLACIVHEHPAGQKAALQGSLVSICLEQVGDASRQLRQWLAICLARLWDRYEEARWTGVRDIAHEKLYPLLRDPSAEVRAAAVHALGTFVNSVTERSEHADSINHTIAMTLLNTVTGDMSVLVRQELVAALQWLVLLFESSFLSVALQQSGREPEAAASPLGLRRAGSRDRLSQRVLSPQPPSLLSDYGDAAAATATERLKRVSSSSSICSMGALHGLAGTLPAPAYGSVYMKLWHGLAALDADPHPAVAQMSQTVTNYIRHQVKEAAEAARLTASVSLPPSPNRGSFLTGESPPAQSRPAMRVRRPPAGAISEEADGAARARKPLVRTQFVAWACRQHAQPVLQVGERRDVESATHYEREWRYMRNAALRAEARDEQRRMDAGRLDAQVFSARCPHPPAVLQFHPYDQQLAVAGRDVFAIWDWGTGAKLAQCSSRGSRAPSTRISALEWVNGHDASLLLAASDDGTVKLWQHAATPPGREPRLITAWQALGELQPAGRTAAASAGVVLAWEQWSQTVVAAGDARLIRLWDAERELRALDLPTGADASVTCLDSTYAGSRHRLSVPPPGRARSPDDEGLVMRADAERRDAPSHPGLIVAGCGDGSVRLFDRRLSPGEARVRTWREHATWVLAVQLRHNTILSGCLSGDVRLYDVRQNSSLSVFQATNGMTSLAIHRNAEAYACGSMNPNISVHNFAGNTLNTIRFYEGFMGHRVGLVSCLAFHPHRVALAAGTIDNSVSVYCVDQKR